MKKWYTGILFGIAVTAVAIQPVSAAASVQKTAEAAAEEVPIWEDPVSGSADSDVSSVPEDADPADTEHVLDHVVFIGDSYGVIAKSRTKQSWMQYAAKAMNLTARDCTFRAYGSTGFCNTVDVPALGMTNFRTMMQKLEHDETVTQVIVGGGFNDRFFRYQQVNEAMAEFQELVKERFPNATVNLAFLSWYKNHGAEQMNIRNIELIYRLAAENNGIRVLDGTAGIMEQHEDSYFSQDELHPNDAGNQALGEAVAAAFVPKRQTETVPLEELKITFPDTIWLDDAIDRDRSERSFADVEVCVYDHSILLEEGRDYAVSTAGNPEEDHASLIVTGRGNYSGRIEKECSVSESVRPMNRLYNPNNGEHFYTLSAAERDHLVSVGWKSEGIGWYAPRHGDAVYRLYNPNAGDHHYTLSKQERDYLVSVGWSSEGIGWYSDPNRSVPLYREYNPNATAGSHNFTASVKEHQMLISVGWHGEGIAWYGVPKPVNDKK